MAPSVNESLLQNEVDALKERVSDTQALYREACALMFFRYGVTPTANKLYQLVKKGSMSAPAQALARFWAELREKSRVRIEHPDLPENVRDLAGDLVGTLWKKAQEESHAALTHLQDEARASVQDANARLGHSLQEQAHLSQKIDEQEKSLSALQGRLRDCEMALAGSQSSAASLKEQLMTLRKENEKLHDAQRAARHEFSIELEKLHAARAYADKRAEESEKWALLEIDRERSNVSKLQNELVALKNAHGDEMTKLTQARNEQAIQIGDFQQKVGVLEAEMRADNVRKEEMSAALVAAQSAQMESNERLISVQAENVLLKTRLAERMTPKDALSGSHRRRRQIRKAISFQNLRADFQQNED